MMPAFGVGTTIFLSFCLRNLSLRDAEETSADPPLSFDDINNKPILKNAGCYPQSSNSLADIFGLISD